MEPRERRAVSSYLEAFVLIGVAVGGSGIVLQAASTYSAAVQGPSISVTGATIRQGAYLALESLTVYNTGQIPLNSFEVSTQKVLSSASYCYSLLDPIAQNVISSTCPSMSLNPSLVTFSSSVAPGGALLVELTVMGSAFALGTSCLVTVTTSAGAQQSMNVQVVPA